MTRLDFFYFAAGWLVGNVCLSAFLMIIAACRSWNSKRRRMMTMGVHLTVWPEESLPAPRTKKPTEDSSHGR